jgi:5-methylcytosine-specific restriction protein A
MSAKNERERLRPTKYRRVIDVLSDAKFDLSDWSDYKGKYPARNPKVYQWSFEQPGERVALFIWWSNIKINNDQLTYRIAPRKPTGMKPQSEAKWKASSERYIRHIQTAYEQQLPIAAIIVDGKQFDAKINPNASEVDSRKLDEAEWAVAKFNFNTGQGLLVRGVAPVAPDTKSIDAELSAFEGWKRRAFIWHRHREAELRRAKIDQATKESGGRLICQIPRCGFDFRQRYGELGKGYAHVHHLVPLKKSPKGRRVTLEDLAVVCANCHAMIHLGGQCRELENIIPR